MLLAANVFDAAIDGLESDVHRAGTRGARREPRVLLSTRITILPCPGGLDEGVGAPLSVPVRDLSRGGLRFLLPRRLPLDTQFLVLLPSASEPVNALAAPSAEGSDLPAEANPLGRIAGAAEQPVAVLCGVAYWQPVAKDLFAIGGHFLKVVQGVKVPDIVPRVVLFGEAEGDETVPPAPVRRAS